MRKRKTRIFALFLTISLLFTGIPADAAVTDSLQQATAPQAAPDSRQGKTDAQAASDSGQQAAAPQAETGSGQQAAAPQAETGSGQERTAAQSEIEAGAEVTYDQTDARLMLQRINAFRTGDEAWAWDETNTEKVPYSGLEELVYDYELEKVAMQRAAELIAAYSHTRPDGSIAFTAFGSEFADSAKGENAAISADGANEQQAFTMWKEDNLQYSGQGHRRNMLNRDFKAVGISHVEYDGCTYWVQVFSGKAVNTQETEAPDGLAEVRMKIANDRITERTLKPVKNSISIKVGETAAAPQANIALRTIETWRYGPSLKVIGTVQTNWSVPAGETLVSLSADGSLQALAKGTAKVKIIYDGIEADIPVTVTETPPPSADADTTAFLTVDGSSHGMFHPSRELTAVVFGRESCPNTRNTLKTLDDLGLPADQVDICYVDIMKADQAAVATFGAKMATAGVTYCYDLEGTANNTLWRYAEEYLGATSFQPVNLPVCVFTDASGNVLKTTSGTQREASLKTLLKSINCEHLLPDNSGQPAIKGLTLNVRSNMYYYPGKYWPLTVEGTQTGDTVEYALAGDNPVYAAVMKKLVHAGTYQVICRVSREGYQTWSRTVTVTVNQIDPEYAVPENIEGKSGTTLANVTLPEGFSWKNPETALKAEGTYSYPAVYTPENTRDYRTVDVTINVKVSCPGHKYTSTVIKNPTTKREGTRKYVCDYCGYAYTEKIDKLPADSNSGSQTGGSSGSQTGGSSGSQTGGSSGSQTGGSQSNSNNSNKVSPPAKVKLKSAKRIGKTKIKRSWKKVSGASGYEIYMKTGKGKYKKIKSLGKTKTSYVKTGLKRKTSYMFRIRAYKKSGKKKIYGSYSSAKKVR